MLRISNHHVSKIVSVLLCVEIVILIASVYLGAGLRFYGEKTSPFGLEFPSFFISACAFAGVIAFSMSALGMYQANFREGFRNTLLRLMPSFALGFGILTLIFYLIPDIYFGRGILGLVLAIAALGILTTRTLIFHSSEFGLLASRIIFLGSGPLADECSNLALNNIAYHRYDIVGFVPTMNEECNVSESSLLPSNESLLSLAKKHGASEIIVSVKDRRGSFPIDELLECKLNGIKVTDAPAFFEREACQIRVDFLQPSWLIFGSGFDQSFLRVFGKRTFDLLVSLLISLITLPIMLITSLLIYIEDRGPIFYRQERVGLDGNSYMVLKFRSMRNDAEKAGKPQWATTNDPRTTKIGSFIRKARIDELPQILNVLKGEMSFVGPRPERPFFVQQLCKEVPFYNMRHSIKPGITGMAQVRYQYGASVEDAVQKLQYDLYYVKNNSLFLDILILIDTLQVVLLGKGAR